MDLPNLPGFPKLISRLQTELNFRAASWYEINPNEGNSRTFAVIDNNC